MNTPARAPRFTLVETPLGWVALAATQAGLRRSTLFHRTAEAAAAELRAFGAIQGTDPVALEAAKYLHTYLAGDLRALEAAPIDLPPNLPATTRTVLLTLRDVPPGQTRSYTWLARRASLGPAGARAVGAIIGANPLPLWLPCHRIVAADGSLHGFAGGLAMKRQLLQHEGALPHALA